MSTVKKPSIEGDEIVVRIPADLSCRVLIAFEGPHGMFPSGWLVDAGNVSGSPPVLLRTVKTFELIEKKL